jgi:hypothetical protein
MLLWGYPPPQGLREGQEAVMGLLSFPKGRKVVGAGVVCAARCMHHMLHATCVLRARVTR